MSMIMHTLNVPVPPQHPSNVRFVWFISMPFGISGTSRLL